MRIVLVGTQKGGAGKTSLVAGLGSLAARPEAGRRVLLVDGDQQANLSRRNFGVEGDGGRNLYGAVVLGERLSPVRDVKPGLDVVPGGPALAMVGGAAASAAAAGLDLGANLRQALKALSDTGEYALCLVDLGPGDVALLDAVLAVAGYVVAPHREDEADVDGVELLIKRVLRARRDLNPSLRFLGTVHFARDVRASARNAALGESIRGLLAGSGVEPFAATVRHSPAVARDARALGLSPRELIAKAEEVSSDRFAMLRRRRHGGQSEVTEERSLWGRPDAAEALARDYLAVLRELLVRMAEADASAAAVAS